MSRYINLGIILVVVLVLTACSGENDKSENNVPMSSDTVYYNENGWYHDLSEDKINEAIDLGNSLSLKQLADFENGYALPISSNNLKTMANHPPEAYLRTPYLEIVEASYNSSQKYKKMDVSSVKDYFIEGTLSFTFITYGNELKMAKNFYSALRQGDVVIDLSIDRLVGQDKLAEKSSNGLYSQTVGAIFVAPNRIDYNKPLELIFNYDGKEDSIIYTVDLSKFK